MSRRNDLNREEVHKISIGIPIEEDPVVDKEEVWVQDLIIVWET